jgi:hypothetical protein
MKLLVLIAATIALLMVLQTQQAWRMLTKFWASGHSEHNRA